MMTLARIGMLGALALVPLAPAAAAEVSAGDLVITQAWTRATPNGAPVAGGYVTITNRGTAADTLTGGSTEVAGGFELHDMTMEEGVMRMRPSGALAIPPGATVTLSPGGRHIMLTGLRHGLKQGETVAGTLTFAHAGTVPVRFSVEALGARGPAAASDHAMPGMKM